MEIIGRLTANATRKTLPDEREVVNFSIAINDTYKPKGATEVKKVVTYVDCNYWLNPKIAEFMKKGSIVQASGSISAHAWKDMDGNAKAQLRFHVSSIKLHGGGQRDGDVITEPPSDNIAPVDDLPF
jgi:single-strand DNA-binding protein